MLVQHKVPTKGGLFASDHFILMADDNKISLPSSGGGLIRYFDEFKSKVSLTPQVVMVFIAVVVVLEIVLHIYGNSFFGL